MGVPDPSGLLDRVLTDVAAERPRRLFVGLEPPDELRGALARQIIAWSELAPALRWTPPGNLHLTLHFLGTVPPQRMAGLAAALGAVEMRPLTVRPGRVGSFGGGRRPGVLWLGWAGEVEALVALAGRVAAACREAACPGDERAYRPHLTLARLRRGIELPELAAGRALPDWTVTGFTLFESRPGAGGVRYLALGRYPAALLGDGE